MCFYLCIYLCERKRRARRDIINSFSSEGLSSTLRKQPALIYSVNLRLALHRARRLTPLRALMENKKLCRVMHNVVQPFQLPFRLPSRPLTSTIFAFQHFCLCGCIYCCCVTPPPDRTLPRHDRGCVFTRPRGHLIRWRGPAGDNACLTWCTAKKTDKKTYVGVASALRASATVQSLHHWASIRAPWCCLILSSGWRSPGSPIVFRTLQRVRRR